MIKIITQFESKRIKEYLITKGLLEDASYNMQLLINKLTKQKVVLNTDNFYQL